MIELDKIFEPFIKTVNECYENAFPGLCKFPKFSLTRAMIILWKKKVHAKIEVNLLNAFTKLIQEKRNSKIKVGKLITEKKESYNLQAATKISLLQILKKQEPTLANDMLGKKNIELITRFVQSIVDLSINEMTVHYLGSTKLELKGAYRELEDVIYKQTK